MTDIVQGAPGMQVPGQGTQETGTPADGDKGFDYQRGYEQLRPEFTRATQELAQHRERLSEFEDLFEALHDPDPEVQKAAFDALGLDLAPEGGSQGTQQDDEFVDPLEQQLTDALGRLEQLESAREAEATAAEQAEMEEARDEYIGEALTFIEQNARQGTRFSEQEEIALGNLAIAMTDEQGVPDVQGAYNMLYGQEGVLELNRQRWIETKTGAPQAPLGSTIPADQKPQTRADRIRYIDERWARMQDQQ